VYGYDSDTCNCSIGFTYGKKAAAPKRPVSRVAMKPSGVATPKTQPSRAAVSKPVVTFPSDRKVWVCVIPLEVELFSGQDHVTMHYSADDGMGHKFSCIPALESILLDHGSTPPEPAPQTAGLLMRHVAVRSSLAQIPPMNLYVTATGLATGNASTENAGTWTFPISQATSTQPLVQQNAGSTPNTGNLLVGYNPLSTPMVQFVEHVVQVKVPVPQDDRLTMSFVAEDSNGQTLMCQPRNWTVHYETLGISPPPDLYTPPLPFYVVIKCKGASDHGTLTVHGHSAKTGSFDTPYVFQK
jgi:hypothetical protein